MSGAATSQNPSTTKATTDDSTATPSALQQEAQQKKKREEEDDEFEDFPVEDWGDDETDLANATNGEANMHLWEESWDDDDTSDDFAVMLKQELQKVNGQK